MESRQNMPDIGYLQQMNCGRRAGRLKQVPQIRKKRPPDHRQAGVFPIPQSEMHAGLSPLWLPVDIHPAWLRFAVPLNHT